MDQFLWLIGEAVFHMGMTGKAGETVIASF